MTMVRFKFLYKNDISWQETEFLRTVRSHPSTLENVFHQKKITTIEQEEWFEKEYSGDPEYRIWLAYDGDRSCPIGYITSRVDSIIHRRVQLYWVPDPRHSSLSLYQILIRGSIAQLSKLEIDVSKVWAYVLPENELLLEALYKSGFEIDALLRKHAIQGTEWKDVYIVSKLVDVFI